MQTIQQQRAAYALKSIANDAKDIKHEDPKRRINAEEYRSHAAALPAMIHINGLGQAAAFYRSKGGSHERLYRLLSAWLCAKAKTGDKTLDALSGRGGVYPEHADLLEAITSEDMHRYRLAQAESQALMDWVVKFAKAHMVPAPRPEATP